ncbi:glycosyltransferase [Flavobacterium azooxidireducens]|uniref:Glycosyltransferase n=1 Tax=Flavobacterium azooxidireducens TaxID=1871076 RepID=A0ABY4KFT7_9FLAO|nr:glycosyltransferase family 2 protein [Flavobacterium azooxidireducens]UPQ79674.1 glycosyltransferase [Flavobacterium azooxidireducens]
MNNALISIIIPTYNRAHLIGETLDSVLAQTYENWECIIVDDGSQDDSEAVILEYAKQNSKFRFYHRPENRPKGANACRNFGLQNAKGDYIVFFDSDDLMTKDHLEVKITAITKNQCDYVITRTQYFNEDNSQIDKYYSGLRDFAITPFNYVSQKINWLTYDICVKSALAKQIDFNEKLQSGQEYNYFCKLVHLSVHAIFVDQVVTLRRAHDTSIRSQLKTKEQKYESNFKKVWHTYLDVKDVANKETRQYLIKKSSTLVFLSKRTFSISIYKLFIYLFKEMGLKSFYLVLYFFSMIFFGKGHFFITKFNENN